MNKAKTIKNTAGIKLPAVNLPDLPKKGFPISQDEIIKLRQANKDKLIFSLRFLDRNHEAFNLGHTVKSWFVSMLDALKEVSNLTRNQLVVIQQQHYDAHSHNWCDLDYCYDF